MSRSLKLFSCLILISVGCLYFFSSKEMAAKWNRLNGDKLRVPAQEGKANGLFQVELANENFTEKLDDPFTMTALVRSTEPVDGVIAHWVLPENVRVLNGEEFVDLAQLTYEPVQVSIQLQKLTPENTLIHLEVFAIRGATKMGAVGTFKTEDLAKGYSNQEMQSQKAQFLRKEGLKPVRILQ